MKSMRSPWVLLLVGWVCVLGEPDVAPGKEASAPWRAGIRASRDPGEGHSSVVPPASLVGAIERTSRVEGDPILTVLALFSAFERRDPEGWVAEMSPEYRFTSDDPAFQGPHPEGFTREDERAFAEHLFRGGGRAPDGQALPVVVRVQAPLGTVSVEMRSIEAERAVAHVERCTYVLHFDDGSSAIVDGSDNALDLALEQGEWRVIAWRESTHAGAPVDSSTVPAAAKSAQADAGASPVRLAIRRLGSLSGDAIILELALPARGGTLELFDLMGRRIASRDLDLLEPGVHRLELPASGVPAGTYWARARQAGAVVSTRVVRL